MLVMFAIAAIALALAFDFINGFHDTANAVATVIHSKALKPRVAIAMSAIFNLIGALTVGTAVAKFITGVVPLAACSITLIWAVLLAAVLWNLLTWWIELPVSSSHCLLGALIGAGLAARGLNGVNLGSLYKALIALVVSPILGFLMCLAITWLIHKLFPRVEEPSSNGAKNTLRALQICSSATLSLSHGGNDGQKTMGVITLILATQFASHGYTLSTVPHWVVFAAALSIAAGTAIGGWKIIRTVGKLCKKPIGSAHGCAAEFTTAFWSFAASHVGVPVSTTHLLNSAVVGGGLGLHGWKAIDQAVIKKIGYAWLLTLPLTAMAAAVLYKLLALLF